MKKYLGLCLNMGLNRKLDQQNYWTKRQSQRMPYFGEVMGQRFFLLIQKMLHTNTATAIPRGQPGFDPWHKVTPILRALNAAFKRYYKPFREISINEHDRHENQVCSFKIYCPVFFDFAVILESYKLFSEKYNFLMGRGDKIVNFDSNDNMYTCVL